MLSSRRGGYYTQAVGKVGIAFFSTTDRFLDYRTKAHTVEVEKLTQDEIDTMYDDGRWGNVAFDNFCDFLDKVAYPVGLIRPYVWSNTKSPSEETEERGGTAQDSGELYIESQTTQSMLKALAFTDDASAEMLRFADAFYATLDADEPTFALFDFEMAHYPFTYDKDGRLIDEDRTEDMESYYGNHLYSSKVLIGLIDAILEKYPDAVIVLEADHGIHLFTEEEILDAFDGNVPAADVWNSVLSCLRVPEQYQNGEEEYAYSNPLNISRYLVNNFVGEENYEYIE